jgi:hypothetical protein
MTQENKAVQLDIIGEMIELLANKHVLVVRQEEQIELEVK